jgi:HAD superfamily hydrolase (TIGR01509 family)
MTLPSPIHAIIFDMDGTLHDTESVYIAAMRHAVQAVGFSMSDAFAHALIGIPGQEGGAMIRAHMGDAFPFEEFDRHYRQRVQSALEQAVPVKAGARELLAALSGRGVKLAIATSARRESAEAHLRRSGLLDHVPVLVTRSDVPRGKPFPDVYLRAAELLGVPPASCLAVEDSFNGVRAAHAAGMMTVMVPDLVQPTDEIRALCARIVLGLDDVHAIIAEHAP